MRSEVRSRASKRGAPARGARAASSLPGTGKLIPIGSLLVSRMAITGMLSLRASWIAIASLLVSITNIRSGMPPMSLMPPRESSSFCCSRVSCRSSFLVRPSPPVSKRPSSSRRRAIEAEMVRQLVSVPPSQRWLT